MPKSQFDSPPLVESKEDFREYLLKFHDDVYGLGDDAVGTLNVSDNLDINVVDVNEDITITGEWTFDTHPLGLDHLLIANIGTKNHAQIDTHIADSTVHFTEESIDHSAIDELAWSVAGHTIDTDFLPNTDDAHDLGSESFQWSNIYISDAVFLKGGLCITAKVNEVAGISIGDVVYISGATGDKPQVSLADNTAHDKAHIFGMAGETKINGENIWITIAGEIRGVDTSGLVAGDRLHLTTAGQWQVAVPTSGAHLHVGRVSKVNVATGIIEVIVDEYVHDIRGVDNQQVEIACGDDDATGHIDFQDYSRNSLMRLLGTGNFGIATETPTQPLSVNEKVSMTSIGGIAIKLTNKTGGVSVAGNVVIASVGTVDAVDAAGANELMAIGIFLDSGVADGSEVWVVVSGIADVHADAAGWALGDRIVTSATAGRGAVNNAPSVAIHFQEIGHAIEVAAANANARIILHFL